MKSKLWWVTGVSFHKFITEFVGNLKWWKQNRNVYGCLESAWLTVICRVLTSPALSVLFPISTDKCNWMWFVEGKKIIISVGHMQVFWLNSEEMSLFYFSQVATKRLIPPDFKSRTRSRGVLQLYCHITHILRWPPRVNLLIQTIRLSNVVGVLLLLANSWNKR